ncbi:aminoglycoside phosphotransferase family protein [Streptomyces sp. 1331.2]|uniref:aminoglycoside phosphotransferase family protein n=1 Tax=Streptomyces sp. 1331.2 TaxID=1938835 RepID=UPI000BC7007F|nr:aminoglycoside phosphotransferase family protein [Streptomyces sp. 1331.2]SOB84812.1 Predicted kinase, aminoglycoside phosphotransferase (APT) family [Streptomyces sp. 1331.2]
MSDSPARRRMHANELDLDAALVRRMVAGQFPHWAGLPVEPVATVGTSNAMYRLGAELVVRIPRIPGAVEDVRKEYLWLRRLAPGLPVAVPVPLALGGPVDGCPWPWSVLRWLDGVNPVAGQVDEPAALAADLASFVTAMRRLDPAGGPASYRSESLPDRDGVVRRAIAALAGTVDARAVTAVWEAALGAPPHSGPPVWIHADLQPGNLLVDGGGRLSAVIDFGCAGLGDPAVDLITAWYMLPASARGAFRASVGADDAAWARGRGWALSVALLELDYYRGSNPRMAGIARHVIGEVLAGHA